MVGLRGVFYQPVRQKLSNAIPSELDDGHKESLRTKIKFGYELSLRNRLTKMLAELSPELLQLVCADPKKFANLIADTRNYFSHYTAELKENAVTDTQKLYCGRNHLWTANGGSARVRRLPPIQTKGSLCFFVNDMDPIVKIVEPYLHFDLSVDLDMEMEDWVANTLKSTGFETSFISMNYDCVAEAILVERAGTVHWYDEQSCMKGVMTGALSQPPTQ